MKGLSKRLNAIASLVDEGSYIADIGSDHCALPIALFEEKKIQKAFAVENKKGPFERMEKAIKNSGFPITASFSSGLSNLPKEVDTVVLAGMGGPLIVRLLSEDPNKLENVQTLIIDAHNERPLVTRFLEKAGYSLFDNIFLIEEGIPYDIMKWKKGKNPSPYTDLEIDYGPLNLQRRPKDWLLALEGNLKEKERILSFLSEGSEKKKTLEEDITRIKGILYENTKSHP